MGIDIETKNDHTKEFLAELEQRIQAALESVGNHAVSHAKSNITQAGRIGQGTMRDSITHQVEGDTCYVGTNNEYAVYHELGTGIYADGGGGRKTPWTYKDEDGEYHTTRGIRPIHFLKNAVESNKEEYRKIIEDELKK